MKNVIVVGATGDTGSYLVDYLRNNLDLNQFQIIAVGRRPTDFFSTWDIPYFQLDISDRRQTAQLPKTDIHAVIHLAAAMPSHMEGYDPYRYIDTNVTGTLNVLEYCRQNGAERIIYTQTIRDIAGYFGQVIPLAPDMPRNYSLKGDHAVYVASKNMAVDLIENYRQEYGLKTFVFRLPTIYLYSADPYYYVDGVKLIMAYRYLIDQAIQGKPIEMWGDPGKAKDIVYVKDLCQIICRAITTDRESGFYNVGSGAVVSIREQIEGMIEVFSPPGRPSPIIPRPDLPDCREYSLDIENARRELGYEPRYQYLDYLRDFKAEMELKRFARLRQAGSGKH